AEWGTLEKETNKTYPPNVDFLKAAIVNEWDKLSKSSSSTPTRPSDVVCRL
ncbi:Uncharacterized protein FKW44_020817, partial [Caligus rogercresseyi]